MKNHHANYDKIGSIDAKMVALLAQKKAIDNVLGEEDDITDEECAEIAEEVHENLIHSLIEAGGTVREARELLTRSLEMLYLLGYDSSFTNPAIGTLTTDIKQFLEDTE